MCRRGMTRTALNPLSSIRTQSMTTQASNFKAITDDETAEAFVEVLDKELEVAAGAGSCRGLLACGGLI